VTKQLSDYSPQAMNANEHTERGFGLLEKSIQEEGWIGAITVANDNQTFDGSARLEKAQQIYGDDAEPIVIESDGTRPIIVKRTDIDTADSEKAKRLAVLANRIQEVDLKWNADVLASIADDGIELSDIGFSEKELEKLFKETFEVDVDMEIPAEEFATEKDPSQITPSKEFVIILANDDAEYSQLSVLLKSSSKVIPAGRVIDILKGVL